MELSELEVMAQPCTECQSYDDWLVKLAMSPVGTWGMWHSPKCLEDVVGVGGATKWIFAWRGSPTRTWQTRWIHIPSRGVFASDSHTIARDLRDQAKAAFPTLDAMIQAQCHEHKLQLADGLEPCRGVASVTSVTASC